MKRLNPNVTKSGPVLVEGLPVNVDGHKFTFAGHYTDRVDLNGNRLTWEWYDVVRDDGEIIGRVSPYTSDDRIRSLFVRIYRDYEPTGFSWACRWPWEYKKETITNEDGTKTYIECIDPPLRVDRKTVNITIPADIIDETRLELDDELKIIVYSVGPEPIALGRRLFHLSKSSKSYVIPLSKLSRYKLSQTYDKDEIEKNANETETASASQSDGMLTISIKKKPIAYSRGPQPGEPVALIVDYNLRTRRRELADVPRETDDPNAPLHDITDLVEQTADNVLTEINDDIATKRRKHAAELAEILETSPGELKEYKNEVWQLNDILNETEDQDERDRLADKIRLTRELIELTEQIYNNAVSEFETARQTLRQDPPKDERASRWSEIVGEFVGVLTADGASIKNTVTGETHRVIPLEAKTLSSNPDEGDPVEDP